MKLKTIPLSLHTRRAVGIFAETLATHQTMSPVMATDKAFELLGYPLGTPDTHKLRAQVVADVTAKVWGHLHQES